MSKNLALLVTTLASTCMLAACSSDEGAQVQSATSAAASTEASSAVGSDSEAMAEYDTGDYPTTYRTEFKKEVAELTGGNMIESNRIANAFVLGFEADPDLTDQSASSRILSPDYTFRFLTENSIDALEALNTPFQSGYFTSSHDADDTKELTSAVIRFESPEKAQAAAKALHDNIPKDNEDSSIYDDDENYHPWAETTLDGREHTLISEKQLTDFNDKTKVQTVLESMTTSNEFLLYNFTVDLSGDAQAGKERINSYLDKQIPLLDTIDTHKTAEGYGKLDNWGTIDPEGLTRYAVQTPEGYNVPSVVGGLNARGFAATQSDPEFIFKALDLAGIENVGAWETSVIQAKNADNAKVFQSAYIADSKDSDYRDYDEPQNLPDTSCVTKDETAGRGLLQCVMIYEDKVALGDQTFYKSRETNTDSTVINSSAPTASDRKPGSASSFEEAQNLLSQKMAAQLAVFKDAKENPEGTKPKPAESVNPNESEPAGVASESASATSTS